MKKTIENKPKPAPVKKPIHKKSVEDSEAPVSDSEYDVTRDDLEALGPRDLSMDMGDDEELRHRVHPVDFAGSDLDVPGAEDDDYNESTGSEDEENNSYSIGGDNHNDLEEDQG